MDFLGTYKERMCFVYAVVFNHAGTFSAALTIVQPESDVSNQMCIHPLLPSYE